MRQIVNISLPPTLAKVVKSAVKQGNYASTSEFFRDLLRDWQERQLAQELKQSKKEIAAGNGVVLSSLKDLR